MFHNFTKSKYCVVFLALILVLMLIAMGREAYRYYKVGREIDNLEKNIEDVKKSNEELIKIKEYFTSKEFLEDEARRKLNMTKEGESVIVISDPNAPEEENESEGQELKASNIKLWLKYFFGQNQ